MLVVKVLYEVQCEFVCAVVRVELVLVWFGGRVWCYELRSLFPPSLKTHPNATIPCWGKPPLSILAPSAELRIAMSARGRRHEGAKGKQTTAPSLSHFYGVNCEVVGYCLTYWAGKGRAEAGQA